MAVSKPYQSPFQVTYDDLVAAAEERLKWLTAQRRSGWNGTHELATQEKLVKLLKKFKKDPQGDLFEMFKNLK